MVDTCPVCGSAERRDVLSLAGMPVLINAQVRPAEAVDVPRGDIDLVVCTACSHLYNRSFDESLLDYDASYENTLHFSPSFQRFAAELADRIVAEHDLVGATVAELGSGPGHFLSMLCDRGVARAVGYDPSYDPGRLGAPEHPAVTITTELFPDDGSVPVAFAFSQHVLEHIHVPVDALAAQARSVAAARGSVYSEVPNGELMVEQCALWDLIYEHLSYFTPLSLDLACRRAGLAPTRSGVAFGDQFLWNEATGGDADETVDAGAVSRGVAAALEFGDAARARIESASAELAALAADGPVVLWGAGSKGATYLNLMVAAGAPVAGVVDINPRKTGWGVPGTPLTISGPEQIVAVAPRTVLAANPVYADEIAAQLRGLGVDADVRPLWGE